MNYAGMADSGGWVQDFTYLWFQRSWHYLAVVLDLKTRQVVGWRLGLRHSSELTLAALTDALAKYPAPTILHSDQGSEYLSYKHQLVCDQYEITLSYRLANYQDIGQLYEAIALTVHYYNHDRIHLALKMSPAAYATSLKPAALEKDKVSVKVGA
jgi:transposase InsO family protein